MLVPAAVLHFRIRDDIPLLVGIKIIVLYIKADTAHTGECLQMIKRGRQLIGILQTLHIGIITGIIRGYPVNYGIHGEDVQNTFQTVQLILHGSRRIVERLLYGGKRLFPCQLIEPPDCIKRKKAQRQNNQHKIDPDQLAAQGTVGDYFFPAVLPYFILHANAFLCTVSESILFPW